MGDRRLFRRPPSFHHYDYGERFGDDGNYSDGSYSDCESCRHGVPPPQIIHHRLRNKKTGQIADYYRYSAQKPCEECCSKRNRNRSQEQERGGGGGGRCGCGAGNLSGPGCPGGPMMQFSRPARNNSYMMGGETKKMARPSVDMCSCRGGVDSGDGYDKRHKKNCPSYGGKH
ncbi:unnamed protein product [Hymenolepis diminuta]|uniref:Uncharacterized protein n=1 Tax=Hymenolepis diminuta TaxID=6216 RepID=A0A564XY25_HYMDI|nr:unnamed protein product [Hymenolepis diminuta]